MTSVAGRVVLALGSAICVVGVTPSYVRSQDPTADIRLVGFISEPREPEFGAVFDLRLNLRVAPGVVVFLPDTLNPAPASVSAGPGEWAAVAGPSDSVDVSARYPVMGFLNGRVELPSLEVWTRNAVEGEEAGVRSVSAIADQGPASADLLRSVVLPTGAIQVVPLAEMVNAEGPLAPRPPADVLGGNYSPWLIAAVLVGLVAGGSLLWAGVTAIRSQRRAPVPAVPVRRLSPREEALSELDRILAQGWHLAEARERLVRFYAASTDVVRGLAEQFDSQWGMSLTSSELLVALRDRWGNAAVVQLQEAVSVAEWVKFGRHSPTAEVAEEHWRTIRTWVADSPKEG